MLNYQWNEVAIPYWRAAGPFAAEHGVNVGLEMHPGMLVYNMHGKDVYVDPFNMAVNGCNDNKPYHRIAERSWTFRSIGYGHGLGVWKNIVSALRMVGYDYVISIEHEDALMSTDEGLAKGVKVLKEACIFEPAGEMFWA